MRLFYALVIYLIIPFALLRLWWRGCQNPAYRKRWGERFGFVPKRQDRPVWVHAVSVGESIAAIPIIKKLLSQKYPVVVTTMTITGGERIKAAFGNTITHHYLPYDTPTAVRRFLKRLNPRFGLIMETEIWPNLYHAAARSFPLFLVNARLSPKSFKHYSYFLPLFSPALNCLTSIEAQTAADAERYRALGAETQRVHVMGNIKFDIQVPEKAQQEGSILRSAMADRPVWIAASTHAGEEEIVLDAFKTLRQQVPNLLLIIVPRHPERFDTVAELIRNRGWSLNRRSEKNNETLSSVDVFLGDTMGELLTLYAASDLALVGGSFAPVGGHNVLEPAALSVPFITGPITFNFVEIMDLMLKAQAGVQISQPEALAETVFSLIKEPARCQAMGEAGSQVVLANRGALEKLWQKVVPFLKE